jgi:hypothetical protein
VDVAGGGSSGRWSRRSPAAATHGRRQQRLGEATTMSALRRPPPARAPPDFTAASPWSSPPAPGRRVEEVPFTWLARPCPGIAGRGSASRGHELNHGGQTAQILALLPRLWVSAVTGRRGCRGGAPAQRPCRQREILGWVEIHGGAVSLEIHGGAGSKEIEWGWEPSGGGGWGSRRE